MKADVQARPVELARAAAFRIGDLELRPATLEVVAADGVREMLEPRVMQVLVVLHERRGEVVSRDTLNELCWGGRVVGDDALQRCISRLRKLGRAHGAFDIENVRGVGLRLVEAGGLRRPGVARRTWVLAAVAAVVALAAAGVLGWRMLRPPGVGSVRSVAVEAFQAPGQDTAGRELGVRLADDVRSFLADNVIGASVKDQVRGVRADLTFGGTVARDADTWRVRATLREPSGAVLWTREYVRPFAEQARLRDQLIVGTTESLVATLEILRQPVELDPETRALYVTSKELLSTGDPTRPGASGQGLDQVLARAPSLGLVRGLNAFGIVYQMDLAPPPERERLRVLAHQEIDRAIRDAPHAGQAYDALYWLTRWYDAPNDLVAAEDALLKGIAAAPDTARIAMRECRFLGEVGRMQAAVPYCERALALDPMSPQFSQPYVTALYSAGSREAAKQAVERFARYHPEAGFVRGARVNMHLEDGEFDEALRLLHSPETRPHDLNPAAVKALELLIEAYRTGTPQAADRALAALRSAIRTDGMGRGYLIRGATQLGRLDDAFAALATEDALSTNSIFPSVYGAGMTPLRKDPRFWKIAKRDGYLRYWRTRGVWPDFCEGPNAEFDCRAAAARAGV
jgi:tetratricopeptide (TPR) repeat protein